MIGVRACVRACVRVAKRLTMVASLAHHVEDQVAAHGRAPGKPIVPVDPRPWPLNACGASILIAAQSAVIPKRLATQSTLVV